MLPKAYINFRETANNCILACESCIVAATDCEDFCDKKACAKGSSTFIAKAQACISSCKVCIGVCDEMLVQFSNEGYDEHMDALNKCMKALRECIRVCLGAIDKCTALAGECRVACRDARDVCERAVMAVDECIESCEKHEVVYMKIKKY